MSPVYYTQRGPCVVTAPWRSACNWLCDMQTRAIGDVFPVSATFHVHVQKVQQGPVHLLHQTIPHGVIRGGMGLSNPGCFAEFR